MDGRRSELNLQRQTISQTLLSANYVRILVVLLFDDGQYAICIAHCADTKDEKRKHAIPSPCIRWTVELNCNNLRSSNKCNTHTASTPKSNIRIRSPSVRRAELWMCMSHGPNAKRMRRKCGKWEINFLMASHRRRSIVVPSSEPSSRYKIIYWYSKSNRCMDDGRLWRPFGPKKNIYTKIMFICLSIDLPVSAVADIPIVLTIAF